MTVAEPAYFQEIAGRLIGKGDSLRREGFAVGKLDLRPARTGCYRAP